MRNTKSIISLLILIILFSGNFIFSQNKDSINQVVEEELVEDEFILSPELVNLAEEAKLNQQNEDIPLEDNEIEEQVEPEEFPIEKVPSILQKEDENSPGIESENQTEIAIKEEESENTEEFSDEQSEEEEENLPPPVKKYELTYEGMDRPEVEKFRQMYLSPKWAKLLRTYLEQALAYRLYVRKSITEQELPEMLEYLPVVESNYKTHAKSSSGAIGLWQFMENSVAPFLVLNDYVDERYDPWKSTDAALKKLTDNYNMFNDWLIAIAAYNCGAGAMNRALKKSEEKSFWALVDQKLIPSQTANYVPKLLAITDLAINHEYYGIDIPDHDEEYETLYNEKNAIFDYVTVKKAYSLSQLAQEMRIETATLKELNPSYILGFTHPSRESSIRLPLGMQESALTALESVAPIEFPFKYKVESGDSLWSISRRYGVTIDAICEINGINENALLQIGKILYIPKK